MGPTIPLGLASGILGPFLYPHQVQKSTFSYNVGRRQNAHGEYIMGGLVIIREDIVICGGFRKTFLKLFFK